MGRSRRALAGAIVAVLLPLAAPAVGDDRHAGYYYPEPATHETYEARATTLPQANRARRIAFVTGLAQKIMNRAYSPPYTVFAKGDAADKMIIVALEDGPIDTLYRARAVLASLTAMARTLPIFAELGVAETYTFLDLCKLLGFRQVTISNGRDLAHQIAIE
jgi:hypothetical protein